MYLQNMQRNVAFWAQTTKMCVKSDEEMRKPVDGARATLLGEERQLAGAIQLPIPTGANPQYCASARRA